MQLLLYVLLPGIICFLMPKLRRKYKSYMSRFFKGVSRQWTRSIVNRFYMKYLQVHYNKTVLSLVNELKLEGWRVILATASFDLYADFVAKALKLDHCISTELEVKDGCYTGYLKTMNCKGREKLSRIKNYIGAKMCVTSVITDHYDDLPLIEWCDKVYIVNPSRKLSKYILSCRSNNIKLMVFN